MKVEIDKVAGAAYINLLNREIGKGEAVYTSSDGNINFDFDKDRRLLGIELLDLDQLHPDLAEGVSLAENTR